MEDRCVLASSKNENKFKTMSFSKRLVPTE